MKINSRTAVTAADSSRDPKQPSRLLKKKNMRVGTRCPLCHAMREPGFVTARKEVAAHGPVSSWRAAGHTSGVCGP
jgi:hypothetical protein